MAATQPPKSSNTTSLLLLVGFIVLAAAGWFAYTQFAPAPATGGLAVTGEQVSIAKKNWQNEIYANPVFTSLKSPLTAPLTAGRKGNPAPFAEEVKKETTPAKK